MDEMAISEALVLMVHQTRCSNCMIWAKSDTVVRRLGELSPGEQCSRQCDALCCRPDLAGKRESGGMALAACGLMCAPAGAATNRQGAITHMTWPIAPSIGHHTPPHARVHSGLMLSYQPDGAHNIFTLLFGRVAHCENLPSL